MAQTHSVERSFEQARRYPPRTASKPGRSHLLVILDSIVLWEVLYLTSYLSSHTVFFNQRLPCEVELERIIRREGNVEAAHEVSR